MAGADFLEVLETLAWRFFWGGIMSPLLAAILIPPNSMASISLR